MSILGVAAALAGAALIEIATSFALRASERWDATRRRHVHMWMMRLWAPQMALVWLLPASWRIPYLVVVSIYANFGTHWGGYAAETPVEPEDTR